MDGDSWTPLLQTLQARLKKHSELPQLHSQLANPTLWKRPLSGKVTRISIGNAIKYEESEQNFEELFPSEVRDILRLTIGSQRLMVAKTTHYNYILFSKNTYTYPNAFGMLLIGFNQDFAEYVRKCMNERSITNPFGSSYVNSSELAKFALTFEDKTIVPNKTATYELLSLDDKQKHVIKRGKDQLWSLLDWNHLVLRKMLLVDGKTNTVFGAILVSDQKDLYHRNALLVDIRWRSGVETIIGPTRITPNDRLKTFILSFLSGGIRSDLTAKGFETWLNAGIKELSASDTR